ncbi:hypothetical protein [Sphingomonas kyeonggiensis]|uniref:Uncharacterized protein n=1 Tax=Sphingomonas kyeonggiensis TaxID=1268553 RepID=A0A7W6NYK1_9SPHN|nr:hypothetical protein [Sphingomonas kyeonggiensis]MBB4100747.1 hypothetical protein [Sphingomonas kyeonggiensis]
MKKRKPFLSDERLRDVWNVRPLDYADDELQDFDKLISSAVARCLAEDDGNRAEIAALLSMLLGERVSVQMLDAYASEARRIHRIPASRFLALIAVTRRFDLLDAVLREVGGKALDRSDARIFKLGVHYLTKVNASRVLGEAIDEIFNGPA